MVSFENLQDPLGDQLEISPWNLICEIWLSDPNGSLQKHLTDAQENLRVEESDIQTKKTVRLNHLSFHWTSFTCRQPGCSRNNLANWTGIKRLVRDLFQMDGFLIFDRSLDLLQVVLNEADPLAKEWSTGLAPLLAREQVAVCLGETC
jgi:hypothetical protein